MKLMSLFVALCFSMNVFAASGTLDALEKHLDDYHYAMSVEWDQKDMKFQEAKTKELFAQMEKLIRTEGLTQEQILKLVEKKTNNSAAVEALKAKLSIMNIGTSDELIQIMRDSSEDMYAQGASWNGSVIVPVAVGLVIVATLGFALWWSATHECSEYKTETKCTIQTTCGGTFPGVSCRDEEVCFNNDVCTDYDYSGPHL